MPTKKTPFYGAFLLFFILVFKKIPIFKTIIVSKTGISISFML